jgi:phosphoenolpyruvate synthase/pyruvate phosphate dikinase
MTVAIASVVPDVVHSDWKAPAVGQRAHAIPNVRARERSIVWLGEQACEECALVGGKAANLCRLASEHPVPPGFCLTSVAFDRAVSGGVHEFEESSAASFPPGLREEIIHAYRLLAERCGVAAPSVAVRSSALDEDGAGASFAGQHETYLNVVGGEAVADAIARCWASAFSARARQYRRRHGLALEGFRIAVLVQQLIRADVSAVIFSANPVTGDRAEVMINASWGLGESIVGGTVTPDTYLVSKADMRNVSRRIAEKGRMTVIASGGTREVEVPRFLRGQPALRENQVMEMAHLAMTLETRMGHPVDVECAYQAGRVYLLQCRPITTLAGSQ